MESTSPGVSPAHDPLLTHRLDAIERKLDRLTAALDPLTEAAGSLPAAGAAVTDVFDEQMRRAQARGIDPELRLQALLHLSERLTDDRTVEALDALLDRVDRLAPLLELLDQAPGFASMLADIADDYAGRLRDEGIDVEQGLARGARAAIQFGTYIGPAQLKSIEALLDSGVLDPQALEVVGSAATALTESQRAPAERVGPIGLLKALRDPDVQQALGFLLDFGRQFGRSIDERHPASRR